MKTLKNTSALQELSLNEMKQVNGGYWVTVTVGKETRTIWIE